MHTRLHRLLLVLVTIVIGGIVVSGTARSDGPLADGVCNPGTHWDNLTQQCVA